MSLFIQLNASTTTASIEPTKIAIEFDGDSYSLNTNHALFIAAVDFIAVTRDLLKEELEHSSVQTKTLGAGEYLLIGRVGEKAVATIIIRFDEKKEIFEPRRLNFWVSYWGDADLVRRVSGRMLDKFGASTLATLEWWYDTHEGPDYRRITMEEPSKLYDSFYPWLGEPVDDYLNRYLSSDASVLFLMGDPGTGKTSLLRHFIWKYSLKAIVTYEQNLFNSDAMFVDLLASTEDAVMIIEDAESLVGAREAGDGVTLMSRLLNVSDGIVKLSGNKKIVFTTNLNDFRGVDPALIRPGRCFGSVRARKLTYEEACIAAKDAGIPAPTRRENLTLADLFNPEQHDAVERIGFGIGR